MIIIDIHLIIIHFAIALLSLATLGTIFIWRSSNDKLNFAFDLSLWLGSVFAFIAVLAGTFSMQPYLTLHPELKPLLIDHRTWALVSTTLYAIAAVWRGQQALLGRNVSCWIRLLCLLGFVALCVTGYYGGALANWH